VKTATRNFCLRVTYLQQVSGLPGSGNDGAGGECLNGEIILQPEGGPDNQSEAGAITTPLHIGRRHTAYHRANAQ